jgi:hypothetical protein
MSGELIPIIMFIVLGIMTLGYFYWNHKNRQAVMDTVQKAIETGGEFSPDLLAQLGAAVNPRVRDLRRGIIFLALGIAGLLCSLFFDDATVINGIRAGSMYGSPAPTTRRHSSNWWSGIRPRSADFCGACCPVTTAPRTISPRKPS